MKKIIKRIIIGNLIISVISGLAIFTALLIALDSAEIIDLDDFGIIDKFTSNSSNIASGNVKALLDSAEKIAKYMQKNGYTYDWSGLTTRYDEGSPYSCCATYVSWCLQDAGFIEDSQHYDNVYGDNLTRDCTPNTVPTDGVWSLVYNNPKWKQIIAQDESDMKPGDITIYKTGKSHTNIYAGDGQYWDAGLSDTGAFVGTTKPHSMDGYTCSYRYIGD